MASFQAIPDLEVLKEPRGVLRLIQTFIGALKQRFNVLLVRVVQWLFAVLAFATACHYSTVLTLKPTCTGTGSASTPKPIKVPISYPFRLLISASSRNFICFDL